MRVGSAEQIFRVRGQRSRHDLLTYNGGGKHFNGVIEVYLLLLYNNLLCMQEKKQYIAILL